MTYRIKEIFYTLQGEGHWTGRPAVFVRFAGCNLWSGHEQDRATAICRFCDTDFAAPFTKYADADELSEHITDHLPAHANQHRTPMVVLTGGEPMLQVDRDLIDTLLRLPLYVAIETNGTIEIPFWLDWVCVSPKAGTTIAQRTAEECKLVYPQPGLSPEQAIKAVRAKSYRLQPMDGPALTENTQAAVDYVLAHPRWSLSLQTHKVIGVR